jgi:polyhydroxyalkanoate synthesis regulator phasin
MSANKNWADGVTDFMRSSFETAMNTFETMQTQGERMMNTFLDQGLLMQQEGRKVLNEWISMTRKNQAEYQRIMSDNLNKFSEFLDTKGK